MKREQSDWKEVIIIFFLFFAFFFICKTLGN